MSDFGLSTVFPDWEQSRIDDLLKKLKDYGVEKESDLKDVSVDDLMNECGMKKLQAKKLFKHHQREEASGTSGGTSISIKAGGNIGEAKTAARDFTEIHHGTEMRNMGNVAGDFVGGSKSGHTYNSPVDQSTTKNKYGSNATVISQSGNSTFNAQSANIGSGTQNNAGIIDQSKHVNTRDVSGGFSM